MEKLNATIDRAKPNPYELSILYFIHRRNTERRENFSPFGLKEFEDALGICRHTAIKSLDRLILIGAITAKKEQRLDGKVARNRYGLA